MRKLSILLNKNDEEFMLQFILSQVKGEIIEFLELNVYNRKNIFIN